MLLIKEILFIAILILIVLTGIGLSIYLLIEMVKRKWIWKESVIRDYILRKLKGYDNKINLQPKTVYDYFIILMIYLILLLFIITLSLIFINLIGADRIDKQYPSISDFIVVLLAILFYFSPVLLIIFIFQLFVGLFNDIVFSLPKKKEVGRSGFKRPVSKRNQKPKDNRISVFIFLFKLFVLYLLPSVIFWCLYSSITSLMEFPDLTRNLLNYDHLYYTLSNILPLPESLISKDIVQLFDNHNFLVILPASQVFIQRLIETGIIGSVVKKILTN